MIDKHGADHPRVSIVILNWNHPNIIDVCLKQLATTRGIDYEVIVVDNASSDLNVAPLLSRYQQAGFIDKLHFEPKNTFFSRGNNIGYQLCHPDSEFVLLMNSDVAAIRPDWLLKAVAWAEGSATYWPEVWNAHPNHPKPGKLDIVSFGWSYDGLVEPSHCRPEGWCLLWRRSTWVDLDERWPFHGGLDKAITDAVRAGARCGLLWNVRFYVVHREQGSDIVPMDRSHQPDSAPDIADWYRGLDIETLDFALGENEHDSYLAW